MRLGLPSPSAPSSKKESILIWGGSTAVGHHAIQLAALSGLRVFVTASPSVHADLKKLGAEAAFDYKDPDIVSKVKDASGDSIKYGLDTVGEQGSTANLIVSRSYSTHIALVLTIRMQGCYQ